jgi:trimethylamine--corrinoid protein Co-methyltransferase
MIRSNNVVNASPRFSVLSRGQVEEIHAGTLEVLRRTGVKVLLLEAREMLAGAGCWVDGEVVRFPAHLVEWAVRTSPSRIVLCDRQGRPAMDLTGYNCYFGTGSDCPNVLDLGTGERREGRLQDVIDFARLVDALPNLDFHMCMAIARELPQETSDIHHFEAMISNTTKPICYTAWSLENLKEIVEIGAHRSRSSTLSRCPRCNTSTWAPVS